MIAAITSCTNTSNPSVMIGAGLLARNAVKKGLKTQALGEDLACTRFAGRGGISRKAGLQGDLDALGFTLVGFGCTTLQSAIPAARSADLQGDQRTTISSPSPCSRATAISRRRVNPDVRANLSRLAAVWSWPMRWRARCLPIFVNEPLGMIPTASRSI